MTLLVRSSAVWSWMALLSWSGASGCEDGAREIERATQHAASDAGAKADSGARALPSSPALEPFTVAIAASTTAFCPGECVGLQASAQHGQPPYSFAWNEALPGTAGLHRVCPTTTTTYRVEATDSGEAVGEFLSQQSADASLTLTARSDCSTPRPIDTCTVTIPVTQAIYGMPSLLGTGDADAAGNLYVAAALTGSAEVAPGRIIEGSSRVFVAKYDAQCELEWVRWVDDGARKSFMNGLDVDPEGRVALTVNMFADTQGNSTSDVALTTFTPDGELAWSLKPSGRGDQGTVAVGNGVAWGSDGTLAVAGPSAPCEAHEGPSQQGRCVARISATGAALFGRWVSGAFGTGVDIDAQGNVYASGVSPVRGLFLTDATSQTDEAVAYVAKFGPDGRTIFLRSTPLPRGVTDWTQGFVHVGPSGEVLAAWWENAADTTAATSIVNMWSLDANGLQQSLTPVIAGAGNEAQHVGMAALADNTLLIATRISNDTSGSGASDTVLRRFSRGDSQVEATFHHENGSGVSLQTSREGRRILTSAEYGGAGTPYQSALTVRRY